ncbi:hypothetical protein [Novosphingobium album (ex Liu et al. 2023)]|uniref:DUF1214 domain-containing protein n=1 Tax=Novosphingobium album (ex Liu et al. 2023) TaxID=3031130 RepID=A0ABT5WTT8_9SPHN|nr:hypothetical protein [Novosphingobium album (ex Liu et al. 2023)]MDE8653305.1 hypothetical protein [Novosphingobium album (ex Liu et al. 2023)]
MRFNRQLWPLGLAAVALAAMPFASRAQDKAAARTTPPSPPSAAPSPVEGWDELIESLRTLPGRMLERLPAEARADPQVRQEVGRLALEALATSAIEAIGADGDAPVFLPSIGQVLNVGQPNADTVYKTANIKPGESYRITGRQGTATLAVIAQVVPGSNDRPHLDLSTLRLDGEGRFDVLVAPEKPAGHAGDFWQLSPQATRLMLRIVEADWSREVQPTIAIERVGAPMGRPRLSAADLEARLRALPKATDFIALLFVARVQSLADEGYVNKFKVMVPPEGALASQFYYDGVYDLADDEALIVESPVPATCRYRSLILTNALYETTDWTNNHSSLNAAQAAPDSDGKLRIIVSAKDPGVKNWLDTAGYPRGIIQGRWTGCDSQPIPSTRKVKLKDLMKALPRDVATVTPDERQQIIRERSRAYQQRALW